MRRSLLTLALVAALPASAHFWLEAPDASFVQSQPYGDPQKTPPCGNEGTPIPTNQLTTVTAGELLSVRIRETIYHPGHYRVALGLNGPTDLPADPPVTPTAGDPCGSTTIQSPPVFPVIADGELTHNAPFAAPQSFNVRIPANVSCTNCTLQVIQYMSSHGAPCFYHHCANLRILPRDAGMGTGGGTSGTGGGTSGTGGGTSGTGGGTSAAAGGSTSNADGGSNPAQMGGCGCSSSGLGVVFVAAILFAAALRRRRS